MDKMIVIIPAILACVTGILTAWINRRKEDRFQIMQWQDQYGIIRIDKQTGEAWIIDLIHKRDGHYNWTKVGYFEEYLSS